MHRRAGRRLQRQARELRWASFRANRFAIAAICTTFTVCAFGVVTFMAFWKGRDMAFFAAGAGIMSTLFVIWFATHDAHARRLYEAAEAERFTSGTLRRLSGRGWRCVDHVDFAHLDIDHVVAGPGGVFAIETKWTNEPWEVKDGVFDVPYAQKAVRQSRDGAERISRLLWGNYKIHCEVAPVLVIWGPGRPTVDTPVMMSGVMVMPGDLLRRTLSTSGGAMEAETAAAVIGAIEDFTRRRDHHDAKRQQAFVRPAT